MDKSDLRILWFVVVSCWIFFGFDGIFLCFIGVLQCLKVAFLSAKTWWDCGELSNLHGFKMVVRDRCTDLCGCVRELARSCVEQQLDMKGGHLNRDTGRKI